MTITNYIISFILAASVSFTCVIIYQYYKKKKLLEQSNNTLKSEKEELVRQIQALELENSKFRLNPHLFKNTLNSIQGYAYRTHQALEKLGGVLDYILYDSNVPYITIKEELVFAQNFIELNKIKLSPLFDLNISMKVDDTNLFYKENTIAPLITAYFIENAFKHADLQSTDAFISILFELDGEEFTLVVSNKINKNPVFNHKGGIGKENIKKRLDILYGDAYELDYSINDDIYTARLKINLLHVKNKMHHIG